MQNWVVRTGLAAVAMTLLVAAHERINTPEAMSAAARNFLDSLDAGQRNKTVFAFQDEERFDFHFIPRVRKGVPLREMTPPQKHLVNALLAAGLSSQGQIKASSIMSLEEVLRQMENDDGERRNPEKYHVSVFGAPAANGVWGYRVEGHHLSLNFTLVNGRVTASPSFFGSNPAEVRQGPHRGWRILGREEDLGRELLASLTADQQKTAIVAEKAYNDILTAASRKAALAGQPSGLGAAAMTAAQRQKLLALLEEYAGNFPEQIAAERLSRVKAAGNNIAFAWAGVKERGGPHYYRVQGPTFLVEYDNTQNGANHIHSVWRDFEGDFGLDLLKAHYESSHRPGASSK